MSNDLNSLIYGICNPSGLCTKVIQVDFQLTDPNFYSMSSLTCAGQSNDPLVNLTVSIQRNVSVILPPPTTSIKFKQFSNTQD